MYQRITIIGRCGKDVEVRNAGGTNVASVSVACSESFKDKNGEKKEIVEWFNIEAWGNLADIFQKYVKKGDLILIDGKIKSETYEKDGIKRTVTKIIVREMKMLGGNSVAEKPSASQKPVSNLFDEEDSDSLPF